LAEPGGETVRSWVVAAEAAPGRVDRVLADGFGDLSRSRIQALIGQGRVNSAGRTITDSAERVKSGQVLELRIPAPEPARPEAQALPLVIVYEDQHLLVLDKPAGLVVHPAPGNPDHTLVNALLAHCAGGLSGVGGVLRPGIVHRLDKETSGLMVVAKTDRAHAGLSAQFADRSLSRTYQALVWGVPVPAAGEISGAIGRNPGDRKSMAVVASGGKPATTRYRVMQGFAAPVALVECRLLTGRTHQIRVHLAAIGHGVIGDPLYGHAPAPARLKSWPAAVREALLGFPRQALHARAIEFLHPLSGQRMAFSCGLPPDMAELIALLEIT
jgi:23S rRNA pseudouridine1911/1915/1917 synthase